MANSAYNLANPAGIVPIGTNSTMVAWFNSVYLRLTNGIKFSLNNNSSNQSIPDTTPTKVTFSTVVTDSIGGWDSTNNQYVVQTQGTYLVNAAALLTVGLASGKFYTLSIYKNGAEVASNIYSAITNTQVPNTITTYIECVQKDTIALYIKQTSGGSVNTNGSSKYTYFQGHRIN